MPGTDAGIAGLGRDAASGDAGTRTGDATAASPTEQQRDGAAADLDTAKADESVDADGWVSAGADGGSSLAADARAQPDVVSTSPEVGTPDAATTSGPTLPLDMGTLEFVWNADPAVVAEATRQNPGFSFAEADVKAFSLPELLLRSNGARVTSPSEWAARRKEILALYEDTYFGRAPASSPQVVVESVDDGVATVGSVSARRRQFVVHVRGSGQEAQLDVLLYLPSGASAQQPAPTFLTMNLFGNQTVDTDSGIRIGTGTTGRRGGESYAFPVSRVLAKGFGFAAIAVTQAAPDAPTAAAPLRSVYPTGAADDWSAIGMWAWAASRALDALLTEPAVAGTKVAVLGHSRLGKTALWAGANDERFALVVSNESGELGAAIARRRFGETLARINTSYPHWTNARAKQFSDREPDLPFDQHMFLALIAPRLLYVGSAAEDLWSDPRGEFIATAFATSAWHLLGVPGLESTRMPPTSQPLQTGRIAYHIRPGPHDLTDYDWDQYLTFATHHWLP